MLQSVIVYGIMSLSLYFFTQVNVHIRPNICEIKANPPQYYNFFIICSLCIFAFFSGVRWDVGIDHITYVHNYEMPQFVNERIEIGYRWLSQLFSKLDLHFSIFFGFIAFLQLAFTYSYFKDCKYLLPFAGLLLMCNGDFFMWMNVIRQSLVATFFLFMIRYLIIERRLFLFLLCVYLSSLIHKSAFILLIFYPLTYLKLDHIYLNKKIQYALFFTALILSSENLWVHVFSVVGHFTDFFQYDRFNNMDFIYANMRIRNFGIRKIIFVVIDLILISMSDKLRAAYPTKLFGFSYIMFILLYVTQPIFDNNFFASRIITYYYFSRVIISSYLLFYLLKYRRTYKNSLLGYIIILLFVAILFIQIYADKGSHTDCIRYQFFWDF